MAAPVEAVPHPRPRDTPSRAAQLRAVGTAFLRARPRVVAPLLALTLGLLLFAGAPRAQLGVLGAGFTVAFSFFCWEAWRGRTRLIHERELFTSLLLTLGGIGFGSAATGGLGSPLLPMLFAPTVIAFAAFGRSRRGGALLAALAGVLAVLAALPVGVPFPPVPAPFHRFLLMAAALTSAVLLWLGVSSLTDAYAAAGESLARAGEEVLAGAEARGRELEALGAQVAHEIKNPLAAIKGLVDLLAEKASDERDRRRLAVASGEVERIERILRDYLSFSRPLGEVRREPVDLRTLTSDLVSVLEARADRAGVRLSTGEGPALRVDADPRRVKEALLNLLLNALEATPRGGSVQVGCEPIGDGAALSVTDTGRGMSPEALARAGEAWFTSNAGGTGLGVRLARRVAEAHGGTLTFDSAPGRGTRATLTLPAPGEMKRP
jgi:signal transduction histidine kinase